MTVYVGSASIDENGNAHGGKAGNQSGKELRRQAWYLHSKGWRVFRAKESAVAGKIAQCMKNAIANKHIGYDQYQRNTLYAAAEPLGFDVSRVTTNCETDCSALVRVCCAYAGVLGLPSGFRTGNMRENLLATGRFTELTADKYTKQSAYLAAGDILVTRTSGHTVVVLNDGGKAEPRAETAAGGGRASREAALKRGDSGAEVRRLQTALTALGYDVGPWGVDGDFGSDTEAALMAFQGDQGLTRDGVYDSGIRAALEAALKAQAGGVIRFSGNCYIRTLPSVEGSILGVAKRGSELPYAGKTAENGWLLARYKDGTGWVSGKYGKREE